MGELNLAPQAREREQTARRAAIESAPDESLGQAIERVQKALVDHPNDSNLQEALRLLQKREGEKKDTPETVH